MTGSPTRGTGQVEPPHCDSVTPPARNSVAVDPPWGYPQPAVSGQDAPDVRPGHPPKGQTMLSILGKPSRLCDSVGRRELLTVGSVGLLGLTLPHVLRSEAAAREVPAAGTPAAGFGRAQSL